MYNENTMNMININMIMRRKYYNVSHGFQLVTPVGIVAKPF